MEKVAYKLQTIIGGKNPTECQIIEEFRGNREILARVIMEKVPRKSLYIIFRQEKDYFPNVLDAYSNIKCGSDKVLEEALRYVAKRIKDEGNPLLIESVIDDCTGYGGKDLIGLKNGWRKNGGKIYCLEW